MPRIRTLKPELWQSEDFMSLSMVGQLAFIALITLADDEGRVKTTAKHLTVTCLRRASASVVQAQLGLMEARGMVLLYEIDGLSYVQLTNWKDHQQISHPSPSKLPGPNGFRNPPENSGVSARAGADRIGRDQGTEGIGRDGSGKGNHGGGKAAVVPITRGEKLSEYYERVADALDAGWKPSHEQAT